MIREDYEKLVLHGLCCEWQTCVMQLKPSERNGLVQPLFAIRSLKGKWGTWSGERKEISLSSDLVHHYSWDSVREVLLHETAHQYAEQILNAGDEQPHGPGFRKACHLLRANPSASAGYPLLEERLSDGLLQEKETVLSRIRKLMALAKSANRFEAESAMNKAHELIRKHQVDFISGPERHDLLSAFAGAPALRHFREDYRLSNLLQDFYFVYGVWVPAFVVDRGRMGTVLEITGRIENVRTARYVYDFVTRFIDTRWKEYKKGKTFNRYRKTDFALGILEGFRRRLEESSKAGNEDKVDLSLMKVEDKELECEVAYRYPRLRKIRGYVVRRDEKILRDGMKIGKTLVVYKGIEERVSTRGKKVLALA